MRIDLGQRSPDIRPGLDNGHLIIQGNKSQKRELKIKEGHRSSW